MLLSGKSLEEMAIVFGDQVDAQGVLGHPHDTFLDEKHEV
jgi:hypothetical protein